MSRFSSKGFFFIEGSIALIAGVGILSAAIFPTMTGYLKRSRDVGKIAQLDTIATSLWAYYADNEQYPEPQNGCVPVSEMKSYFPKGVPTDPSPGRLSGECDGTGGMTYGYGTYTKEGGFPWFYLIAHLENYNGGNSYMLPGNDVDEAFFESLKRGNGPYFISHY